MKKNLMYSLTILFTITINASEHDFGLDNPFFLNHDSPDGSDNSTLPLGSPEHLSTSDESNPLPTTHAPIEILTQELPELELPDKLTILKNCKTPRQFAAACGFNLALTNKIGHNEGIKTNFYKAKRYKKESTQEKFLLPAVAHMQTLAYEHIPRREKYRFKHSQTIKRFEKAMNLPAKPEHMEKLKRKAENNHTEAMPPKIRNRNTDFNQAMPVCSETQLAKALKSSFIQCNDIARRYIFDAAQRAELPEKEADQAAIAVAQHTSQLIKHIQAIALKFNPHDPTISEF